MALSDWKVDAATGTMSRELRGSGERQILKGEEPPLETARGFSR
jgi:hypothetical protein